MLKFLMPFLIALIITFLVTPLVRKVAIKIGAYDLPDERKVHKTLIPRLGGIAIVIGYVLGIISSFYYDDGFSMSNEKIALIEGTILLVIVGLWDDLYDIGPKIKLCGQILAAFIITLQGINIEFISFPNGQMIYFPYWLSIMISVFWIVGFTNVVNLIDGLDGLAAGISFIACITIFAGTIALGQTDTAIIVAALAGSALAFLKYNFNPAKIFMGDTGSMLLGYTLGAVAIIGVVKTTTMVALIIPVIVLGVPIMDTSLAIFRRMINNKPIFKPDKGHMHHRLLAMGLSHKQSVLLMYGMTLLFGLLAVVMTSINFYIGVLLILILIIAILYMAKKIGVLHKDLINEGGKNES